MSQQRTATDLSVALTGSGGAGAITAGDLLLHLAGRHGLYGLMKRSFGPQIRGGEAASLLRISARPVQCMNDAYDLWVPIDWLNAERFAEELTLRPGSLLLADPAAGEVPERVLAGGVRVLELPLKELARSIEGGRENMVAVGAMAACIGLDEAAGSALVEHTFKARGAAVAASSVAAFAAGFAAGAQLDAALAVRPEARPETNGLRWSLSGNEGCGLGAVRGGIRFAAAYPITPASDILEWLAPRLEQLGGSLLQAEDELASINMVIGASFGGVPSMTATSGPGLSLMLEGLGLAVASETPALVVNVQRGGPSTGIPTKSEQADLDQALHGLHGDAPHLVLGALGHADCILTTEWAARLAEHLQTVAIVLTDQYLAQSRVLIERPHYQLPDIPPRLSEAAGGDYRRYADTPSGVSNMAVPGMAGGAYTADGLEHTETGKPSTAAADHLAQLDKRQRKISSFDYGVHWADISGGDSSTAIITWGSSTGAVREAAERLAAKGQPVRLVAIRLLAPASPERLRAALTGCTRALVVEQSHSRQFHRYLRAHYDLPAEVSVLARPGPLLISPAEVVSHVENWS